MFEDIENIKEDLREYVTLKLDLIKLQTAETLSRVVSKAVIIAVVVLLLLPVVFFLSFAAGYFLSSLLDSKTLGFLCVAGFYLLLMIVFLLFRRRLIERPVIRSVVCLFFNKKSTDETKHR